MSFPPEVTSSPTSSGREETEPGATTDTTTESKLNTCFVGPTIPYNVVYFSNSLGYLDSRMRVSQSVSGSDLPLNFVVQVRSIGDFGSVLTIRNFDER